MNSVIYKSQLHVHDHAVVMLPSFAQVLTVQMEGDKLCLWARVDPGNPQHLPYTVWMVGTGHSFDLPSTALYLGTVQLRPGLVLHCFGSF